MPSEENQIHLPAPGSNRRQVYDSLDYDHGRTTSDLQWRIRMLDYEQIYDALRALRELGLVERRHRGRTVLWYRTGSGLGQPD